MELPFGNSISFSKKSVARLSGLFFGRIRRLFRLRTRTCIRMRATSTTTSATCFPLPFLLNQIGDDA